MDKPVAPYLIALAIGDLKFKPLSANTGIWTEPAMLDWHTAPVRQLVITLSGTLDFQTREGAHFVLRPGDVLLAEDTVGSGHSWKLIDNDPWRRVYVVLADNAVVPFRPATAH